MHKLAPNKIMHPARSIDTGNQQWISRAGDDERWTKPLRGRFNSQSLLSSVQYQLIHCYYSWATSFTRMPAHHLLHSLGGHESHGAGISTYHRGQS